MNPGTLVGAERWPYDGRRPWSGIVLDPIDPRAWAGSIAFPVDRPSPLAVACHVAWCETEGLLDDRIPVLWEFGKVYWERPAVVRRYDEDKILWRAHRRLKRTRWQRP